MDYYIDLVANTTELGDELNVTHDFQPDETEPSKCEDIRDIDDILSLDSLTYEKYFGEHDANIAHYQLIPVWIFILLLIIGCSGNIINILVYSRPFMKSPISLLLISLEVINLFVFGSFIPDFVRHFNGDFGTTYGGIIVETYFPAFETAIIGVSNWLTVLVGLWRFIAVKYPLNVEKWCNRFRTKFAILAVVVLNAIVACPQSLMFTFRRDYILNVTYNENTTEEYSKLISFYTGLPSQLVCNHPSLETMAKGFILLTTSIPVFFLAIVTVLLLVSLWEAKKRRQCMKSKEISFYGNKSSNRNGESDSVKETRLTALLLLLVFLYFLAYLPDSVINIQSLTMSDTSPLHSSTFYKVTATRITILVCNASTFFIYYVMSERFREALYRIVLPSRFKSDQVKKSTLTLHSFSSSKSTSTKDVSTIVNA